MSSLQRGTVGGLALLLLAGCSGERAQPRELLRELDAAPRKAIPTPVRAPAPAPAAYPGAEVRSPFSLPAPKPKVRVGLASNVRPNPARKREPLERFALGTLRLVGFVEQGGELFALVQPPEGRIARVVVGSHLGRNHGRVTRLGEDGLDIVEVVPNGAGAWMERRRRMRPAADG